MTGGVGDLRLRPMAGHGLVGRLPGMAVLVLAADDRADAVLDACWGAAAEAGPPGGSLAGRLGALAASGTVRLPPFAVLADSTGEVRVLAHGEVTVVCTTPRGDASLTGDPSGLVDRVLDGPLVSARVGPAGAPVDADARLDLGAGIVPGAGFELGPDVATVGPALVAATPPVPVPAGPVPATGAGAEDTAAPATAPAPVVPGPEPVLAPVPPAPPAAPAPVPPAPATPPAAVAAPAPAAQPFESVLLLDAAPPDDEPRAPLPLAEAAPAARPPARVLGVSCSRGHFNDPEAYYCAQCGISLVQQTMNLVEGDRPSLGFLVFDDGATYTLDIDYVVGREPHGDPRVRADEARALLLDDAARTVSRVHAEVRLDGWRVTVVDRGSTNGSFVWSNATGTWQRLTPGEVVPLEPGLHASFGQRVFRFESPHDQRA